MPVTTLAVQKIAPVDCRKGVDTQLTLVGGKLMAK